MQSRMKFYSQVSNRKTTKGYKKERASQRLAKRGGAPPLHDPNACKTKSLGRRNRTPSKKKSIIVRDTKPQGISISRREETNRPRSTYKFDGF